MKGDIPIYIYIYIHIATTRKNRPKGQFFENIHNTTMNNLASMKFWQSNNIGEMRQLKYLEILTC